MRADPAEQRLLLDLAGLDTDAARIRRSRRTLPEIDAVAAAEADVVALRTSEQGARAVVAELSDRQTAADGEVAEVRARIDRNRRLMDGSAAAKEVAALQHEVETLTRRQNELEDAELEVMEELEAAEAVLAGATRELEAAEAVLAEGVARRDDSIAALDMDAADVATRRGELATSLPAGLLDLYESVRAVTGDTGAALLTQGRCQGCHLDLPATVVDEIRSTPAEEIVQCEECQRVLVRTEVSGL